MRYLFLSILVLFNDFKIIYGFSSYELIVLLVLLASILDFFDGFLARALKSESKIGGQLDSFSDSITFGLVPSLVIFDFLYNNSLSLFEMIGPILAMGQSLQYLDSMHAHPFQIEFDHYPSL